MTLLFGAAYYPEHRDPAKWEYDLDHMAAAHVNCLRVGEFAWSRFEPADGEYDFSWMDTFASYAAKREIRLLLCPPLRTLPSWLFSQDESLRIEREDGVKLEYGSRYSFCINHPLLQQKGRALAEAMSQHYASNPTIAGWHLDNEHGDEPDCHCPICREKFQNWCKARYGDIETLNERWGLAFWGLQYQAWGQIPTPRVSKTWHSPGHLQAWRRFRSDCTVESVKLQADGVRAHAGADQFVTTNNQPNWNSRSDYFEMDSHLDIAGTNYYPPYGPGSRDIFFGLASVRGYKRAPFQVHELRNSGHMIPGRGRDNRPAPGEVERLTLHCIANGADATFYFRWRSCPYGCEQSHGSIVDFDGRPRRIYPEVQRTGARIKALAPRVAGLRVEASVAILYDFPSRWVLETGVPWNGPHELYMQHTHMLHRTIRNLGYGCDVTGAGQDWNDYKVLVVPMLPVVDDTLADKLVAYVKQGGTVLWHPLSGTKDQDAVLFPDRCHRRILDIAGVTVQEFLTFNSNETVAFTWNGKTYTGASFADTPELNGAAAKAEFTGDWYEGIPALTESTHGNGRFVYLMTFAKKDFYIDFLPGLLSSVGAETLLPAGAPPAEVEVSVRVNDKGERLTFLMNHSGESQTVKLGQAMTDAESGEMYNDETTLAPYATRVVVV